MDTTMMYLSQRGFSVTIPGEATECCILARHALSVQDGPNETRTLTTDGAHLCAAVQDEYGLLVHWLAKKFGEPIVVSSTYPRALLTAFLVTGSEQIVQNARLCAEFSIKAIQGGHWFADRKADGWTVPQMIQFVSQNMHLLTGQSVGIGMGNLDTIVRNGVQGERLTVCFGHEPGISLYAASQGAPADQLGLNECQGFVFFIDGGKKVISVQKFAPEATL